MTALAGAPPASRRPTLDKYRLVRTLLAAGSAPPAGATLLDVGCRGCELEPHVRDFARYTGVDLVQNDAGTVDHVLNVERGLPFADRSFDYVVAMDLLEHLDGFDGGMRELARVTRRTLLVVLPNLAHLFARLSFLARGRFAFTTKYDLPLGAVDDRHRWVTVIPQTDAYMRWFAREAGFTLRIHYLNDSRSREALGRVGAALRLPPGLWAWKVAYVLDRPAAGTP
jgi:ubiquinone/menaquinone biosynthesis C-methylase UbiE